MTVDTFPDYRLKSGVLKEYLQNTVFSGDPARAYIQVEVSYEATNSSSPHYLWIYAPYFPRKSD